MTRPDTRPVRRVQLDPRRGFSADEWPYTVPAVRQLVDEGLDLPAGVTFLVGENGSGKSTVVEGVAGAYGLGVEGGSTGSQHLTRATESPLAECLQLVRSPGRLREAFFLRAETMHSFYSYLEQNPSTDRRGTEPRFHEMSHGESFLEVVRTRFAGYGFFVMDEPEAALSFGATLALMASLDDLRREGAQVLVATHSPVLAALPGAHLLELGEHGIREAVWDELDLVRDWRSFLGEPQRWLRHLLA